MTRQAKEKAGRWANWGIQIILTVASGVILTILLSGGSKFTEIQKNSDAVPGMRHELNNLSRSQRHADSVMMMRYIFDTIERNQNRKDHAGLMRELKEIKDAVKKK